MKYIGTVLGGLIEIFIVFAVLNHYEFDDNQVIIASIIILYSTMRMIGISNGMIWKSYLLSLDNRINQIEDLIDPKGKEDRLADRSFSKPFGTDEKLNTEDIKNKIRMGVIFIVYIIGIFGLLGNL